MRKRLHYGRILWLMLLAFPAALTRSGEITHFCNVQKMEVFGLVVGEGNFQDAKDGLGDAEEYRIGQGESDARYLCYKVSVGNRLLAIQLESSPLGGPGRTITGFTISSADTKNKSKCRLSASVLAGALTNLGITTDDSVTQILKKLGVPDNKSKNHLTYQCNSRRPMTAEEIIRTESAFGSLPENDRYFDLQSTLKLSLTGKRIRAISVRQTETY